MATVGKTYLTLKDMYSQMEGDGKVTATIIDLFAQSNTLLLLNVMMALLTKQQLGTVCLNLNLENSIKV